MMTKDKLNCPNCGAPLQHDGTCEYCGTKVNRINQLYTAINSGGLINLTLNITDEHNNVITLPMCGHIDQVNLTLDTYACGGIRSFYQGTDVSFTFNGSLLNKKNIIS